VQGVGLAGPALQHADKRRLGAVQTLVLQVIDGRRQRLGEGVRVVRLLGANDSGRVINRKTFDTQVYGGMVMGLGYALAEKRVLDRQTGKMCNPNFHDYKLPTALDAPANHEVVPIDLKDNECNNVGCKGLGEPAHVPTAAAIANAVYNAIGVRPVNNAIDNKMILELLGQKKRG